MSCLQQIDLHIVLVSEHNTVILYFCILQNDCHRISLVTICHHIKIFTLAYENFTALYISIPMTLLISELKVGTSVSLTYFAQI